LEFCVSGSDGFHIGVHIGFGFNECSVLLIGFLFGLVRFFVVRFLRFHVFFDVGFSGCLHFSEGSDTEQSQEQS